MIKWTIILVIPLLVACDMIQGIENDEELASYDYSANYYSQYQAYQFTQDTNTCRTPSLWERLAPSVKLRVGAFIPASKRFRDIYGNSMPTYQIETSGNIYRCINGWINLGALYKKGDSYKLGNYTTVQIWDLSAGVTLPYQLTNDFSAYAGLGAAMGFIKVHNRYTDIHKNESKIAWGIVVKSGLNYAIDCHYFLDLFIDYLYMPNNFRTNVNIGGVKTGLGVGYQF